MRPLVLCKIRLPPFPPFQRRPANAIMSFPPRDRQCKQTVESLTRGVCSIYSCHKLLHRLVVCAALLPCCVSSGHIRIVETSQVVLLRIICSVNGGDVSGSDRKKVGTGDGEESIGDVLEQLYVQY